MSEYGLTAKLKNFRENEEQKIILKPFDRHNLLGHVEIEKQSIDDILNEEDEFGLLDSDKDLEIFKYKHISKPEDRAETDFVAQRKPIKEKEFLKYEQMFQQVHKEISEGKRKIKPFTNIEKNLHVGDFYLMNGIMLYLESANLKKEEWEQKSGNRVRVEGRTRTIFENGTYSNMLYRSLGKQIQKDGKLITNTSEKTEYDLFINSGLVEEEDVPSGWIYVLKSKSKNPKILEFKNLYKIGYSSQNVMQRVKNAKNEATYLYDDVDVIATYKCFNSDSQVLEKLIHRFFASKCLNVDIETSNGKRVTPREWFDVPFEIIDEAINRIIDGSIVEYKFDVENNHIVSKN